MSIYQMIRLNFIIKIVYVNLLVTVFIDFISRCIQVHIRLCKVQ